jgi:phage major head subunit gpT-like protein
MIINQSSIQEIYIAFNAIFTGALNGFDPAYKKVSMTVPSTGRINDYKFMLQFPNLQEWIGDRKIRALAAQNWTIQNKDYEASIEVDRNDIEDDQIGLYAPIIRQLGLSAGQHPDILISTLIANGWTTACYDGQNFISTTHPQGSGTQSNSGGGASTAWYLIDNTKGLMPFIWQQRTVPQLVQQDQPGNENYFLRKKYRYGVDYRGAAGYGLWQLCYGSKQTLNVANFQAAYNAMMTIKNDDGTPFGIVPNLLVVPPSLQFTAREILQAAVIDTGTGGKTNINQGVCDLLVYPYLS